MEYDEIGPSSFSLGRVGSSGVKAVGWSVGVIVWVMWIGIVAWWSVGIDVTGDMSHCDNCVKVTPEDCLHRYFQGKLFNESLTNCSCWRKWQFKDEMR